MLNIQYRLWNPQPKAIALIFGLILGLGTMSGAAQQAGGQLRELPAAANPPQELAEQEARAKEDIPKPPAKGQGRGRALPASSEPPPELRALEEELDRRIPDPPGRARAAELVEKISGHPGGKERVEAAKSGSRPGRPDSPPGKQGGAKLSNPDAGNWLLAQLSGFFVEEVHAQSTFTVDLTPQVNSAGAHAGLYSSSPYANARAYGALVHWYVPNSSRIYQAPYNTSWLGGASGRTTPAILLVVNVPADGWYIINMNHYAYGDVTIRHYEGSSPYTVLKQISRQSGWADYPTLQYLSAGLHYFSFVMPNGGYVSRLSVDSYP